MDHNAFQLIPTDVIKAWSKGEYYVGDIPSISYRHLGIALLMRGWYTYVDTSGDPTRETWSGVAKVDIKGSVLAMGGVRLFGREAVFWRTEHSFIQDESEIIWFYSGFSCDSPTALTNIRSKYIQNWTLDLHKPETQFGMDAEQWAGLLKTLATSFDEDVELIAQTRAAEKLKTQQPLKRDLGMLRFRVNLEPNQRVRLCEYYHYDSAGEKATAGLAEFRKVTL
jgi:hypothetical protein